MDQIDQLLQKFGVRSLWELDELVQIWKERQMLDLYREALSLWAEYHAQSRRKIICTLDGRDTAGKGNNVLEITRFLDTGIHNIIRLWIPKNTEKKKYNWFDRYENFFPSEWHIHFFDRSWYNRASVEPVMGFCTEDDYRWFIDHVNDFEKESIIEKGFDFVKVYLSVSQTNQKARLEKRSKPMERWKLSLVDRQALDMWYHYTKAKLEILTRTDSEHSPWIVIDSNERFLSAVEIIKAIIRTNRDICQKVEKELWIDLSPDFSVVRTAKEELERMKKSGSIESAVKEFNFKK